jgi:hypothetical protein
MIFLSQILIENMFHILTPGDTGTGKSINAMHLISKRLVEQFISSSLVLSG